MKHPMDEYLKDKFDYIVDEEGKIVYPKQSLKPEDDRLKRLQRLRKLLGVDEEPQNTPQQE